MVPSKTGDSTVVWVAGEMHDAVHTFLFACIYLLFSVRLVEVLIACRGTVHTENVTALPFLLSLIQAYLPRGICGLPCVCFPFSAVSHHGINRRVNSIENPGSSCVSASNNKHQQQYVEACLSQCSAFGVSSRSLEIQMNVVVFQLSIYSNPSLWFHSRVWRCIWHTHTAELCNEADCNMICSGDLIISAEEGRLSLYECPVI